MEHRDDPITADELPGCDAHWVRIERFAAGVLPPSETEVLRAHREHCSACDERFRSAVETTAKIGRERRRERDEIERVARHEQQRRDIFETGVDVPSKLHRLRTLVYPAFFAFLMVQLAGFTGGSRAAASIARVSGDVLADDLLLRGGDEVELARGAWCSTGAASSALASVGDLSIAAGALTQFAVERVDPPRIRLETGELELSGSCVVSTPYGVLELDDAHGILRVESTGLSAENFAGTLVHTGSDGAREVAPGVSMRLGPF